MWGGVSRLIIRLGTGIQATASHSCEEGAACGAKATSDSAVLGMHYRLIVAQVIGA